MQRQVTALLLMRLFLNLNRLLVAFLRPADYISGPFLLNGKMYVDVPHFGCTYLGHVVMVFRRSCDASSKGFFISYAE